MSSSGEPTSSVDPTGGMAAARGVVVRCVLALATIGVLTLVDYCLTRAHRRQLQYDAAVVNVSGRQRMLLNRAALLVERLTATTDRPARESLRDDLRDVVQQMTAAHQALHNGDSAEGVPAPPAELHAIFEQRPHELHRRMEELLQVLEKIVNVPDIESNHPWVQTVRDAALGDELLNGLDEVVRGYVRINAAKLDRFNATHTASLVLIVMVLIAIGLFGIRPMVRQIKSETTRLESVNEALASQTRELNASLAELRRLRDEQLSKSRTLLSVVEDLKAERTRLAEQMRERQRAEERLRFALQMSHTGGWDLDLVDHTAHRTLEHDRIFGYGVFLPQWTYEMFLEHVLPEDRAEVDRQFREATAAQTGWSFECRIRRVDGEVRWIWATGEYQRDDAGQTRRMAGIVQDISERRQAEEQIRRFAAELERSNKELDQFAYSASHDLKAPLRAIDNLARWMAEDAGAVLPEQTRADLALMQQRIARMERLLDDLLAYSRVGRVSLKPETIDLGSLVREVIALLSPPETFTFQLGDFPTLTTYKAPLEQVFRNLIGNAIKHHDRLDGRVEISAREEGSCVEFTVRDDGPGIPPEFHEQIFQMFQTLKPRDEVEGSGMGLALVRKLVENQGGTIHLESRPGEGSAFRFVWPPTRNR